MSLLLRSKYYSNIRLKGHLLLSLRKYCITEFGDRVEENKPTYVKSITVLLSTQSYSIPFHEF